MTASSYYTHGTPVYTGHGSFSRTDTYHCAAYPDLDGGTDRLACASSTDDTPIYSRARGDRYDPTCACCWLGHGHTVAMHQQLVDAQAARQAARKDPV